VAVYPIASFEQHGHHLPLLTDTLQCDAIVGGMEDRVGDRIVTLPTQWLGHSFHHMRFGGSLTATSQTHIRLIVETVEGLLKAGFDKVLIINGHGGNQADMRVALQDLRERHIDARVYGASWWEVAAVGLDEVRTAGPDGSGHAGETETSMMLHLHPDLVRTDRLHAGGARPDSDHGGQIQRFHMIDEVSPRGNFGDPTVASADKGQRMLQAVVDSLCEVVDDILSGRMDPQPTKD
jgi:creatinine amidohydrolase